MSDPSPRPTCRPQDLTLYHYGELEEPERLQLERHLQECGDCRRQLEELRSTLALLPQAAPEPAAAEVRAFNQRLLEKLEPRRTRRLSPVWGWSFATAAAALLLVTLGPLRPTSHQPPAGVALHGAGGAGQVPDAELLLNLDLLENLDMLQQLEGAGIQG